MGNCSFCAKKIPAPSPVAYNIPKKTQSDPKEGESVIYRNPVTAGIDLVSADKSLQQKVISRMEAYKNKPLLGIRNKNADGTFNPAYDWQTYEEVKQIGMQFGSGLIHLNLVPEICEWQNRKMKFIAMYVDSVAEWVYTDIAAIFYNFTTIPMFDELSVEATEYVFEKTNAPTILLSNDHISEVVKMIKSRNKAYSCVTNIVVLQESLQTTENITELNSQKDFTVGWMRFSEVVEAGNKYGILPMPEQDLEHTYTLYYTSGTTGVPKAAMLSSKNFATGFAMMDFIMTLMGKPGAPPEFNMCNLSMSSFGHMGERAKFHISQNTGGKYALNKLEKSEFLGYRDRAEDLRLSGATALVTQPIFWNDLHRGIQKEIDGYWWPFRWLYNYGISVKRKMLKQGYIYHLFYDRFLFNRFRNSVGIIDKGGVDVLCTGSSAMSIETKEFVQCVLARPLVEGLAMTESCGQGFTTTMHDTTSMNHVGGINFASEFKLVSVPELNIHVNHKDEKGVARPRGEIYLRSTRIFQGYYKDEESTNKAMDQDGWYRTGDIGTLVPEMYNALQLFDRKSNCFKLSNGKHVTPEKLELHYKECKLLKNVWLFADPKWDQIVAVVNVDQKEFMREMYFSGIQQKKDLTFDNLIKDKNAISNVLWHIQRTIEKVPKISPYEIVQGIIIEPTEFTELGVYTLTGKLKRRDMKTRYYEQLNNLYQRIKL